MTPVFKKSFDDPLFIPSDISTPPHPIQLDIDYAKWVIIWKLE